MPARLPPWPFSVDRRLPTLGLLMALALTPAADAKKAPGPTTFEELRAVLSDEDDAAQRVRLERFARNDQVALSDRLLANSASRRLLDKADPALIDVDIYEAYLRTLGNAQGLREKALLRAAKGLREHLLLLQTALEAVKAEAKKRRRTKKSKKKKSKKKKKKKKSKSKSKKSKLSQDGTADAAGNVGAAGAGKKRSAKELERAIKKTEERLAHVEAVREGDKALAKLRRALRNRAKASRRSPADAAEASATAQVTDTLPHYKALGHDRQHAEATLALALFLEHSDAARPDVDRALKRLVRVGGRSRDLARVRQKVRRARARVLEEQGDIKEAVHESLVADRAVKVPLRDAAFDKPPPRPYQRSRTTAELCWRAYARGVRCAELEEARSGTLSFYDYAKERRRSFDHDRARMVIAEYEPLLLRCLAEAASAGNSVTNTTVQLEWAIELDGHVRTFSVTPRRLRGTPLEQCFKGAFERFRYPRYRGEMQHTQLSFNVGS